VVPHGNGSRRSAGEAITLSCGTQRARPRIASSPGLRREGKQTKGTGLTRVQCSPPCTAYAEYRACHSPRVAAGASCHVVSLGSQKLYYRPSCTLSHTVMQTRSKPLGREMGCTSSKQDVIVPEPGKQEPGSDARAEGATTSGESSFVRRTLLDGVLEATRDKPVNKDRARKGLIGRHQTFLVRLEPEEDAELSERVDDAQLVGLLEATHREKGGGKPVSKPPAGWGLIGRKQTFVVRLEDTEEDAELSKRVDAQLDLHRSEDAASTAAHKNSSQAADDWKKMLIGRRQTFLVRMDEEQDGEGGSAGAGREGAGADAFAVPQRKMWIKHGSSFLSRMDPVSEQAILQDMSDAGLIKPDETFMVCTQHDVAEQVAS